MYTEGVASCSAERLRGLLSNLSGKRVVVLGLGMFRGGEGAARFMASRGARVLVTDLKQADQFAPVLKRLSDLPIEYQFGGHRIEDIVHADLVVANPAVPRQSPILARVHEAGVPLSSPMNVFLTLCPAPVTAVTGSIGKSTTTAMLAAMLRQAGRRVHLGGNIGVSLLPALGHISHRDVVVLEISCFQLEDTASLPWSPHVAVITNLTPNHLDRYGTQDAYVESKRSILAFQAAGDAAVLGSADPVLQVWARTQVRGKLLQFDGAPGSGPLVEGTNLRADRVIWSSGSVQRELFRCRDVRVPGVHNLANAMAAATAARWLGAKARHIRQTLGTFRGLEHRLESCGRLAGVSFYNDSNSTSPECTVAGVLSFSCPVTLIAGGHNKGLELAVMTDSIARRAHALVAMGECGPRVAELTRQAAQRAGRAPIIREVRSLEEAVGAAVQVSRPGSAVLFSPGCASFDMFENFAHRGRAFKSLVRQAAARSGPRPRWVA